MKMKLTLLFLAALFSFELASAQTYYYYSRTEYTYGPYYFQESLNFVDRLIKSKEEKDRQAAERERMRSQTKNMRDYYGSFEAYPERISDGWHSVVILGGDEYIGDRKVFVESGRVKSMIWDDWMPEELTFSGPIVKAMAGVRIKGGTGPLGGMVDVYFMNSLGESPVMAEPPMQPGRVTFWTSAGDYDLGKIHVIFEDAGFGPFVEHRAWDDPASCGDNQQINVVYKPGVYKYKVVRKSGAMSYSFSRTLMEGKIEITEGGCELVEVYDPRKKQKGPKKKKKK